MHLTSYLFMFSAKDFLSKFTTICNTRDWKCLNIKNKQKQCLTSIYSKIGNMKLKKLKLYFIFYRSFYNVSVGFSLACTYFFYKYGLIALNLLFWPKLALSAAIPLYIRAYKASEFYFHKNLGISSKQLWTVTMSADLPLYFLLTIIALNLHATPYS